MKLILELILIVIVAILFDYGVIYGLDKQAAADQVMVAHWLHAE